MKKSKIFIGLLTLLAVLLPLGVFPSSAEETPWRGMGAKFSSTSHQIISPNGIIKDEGFYFTATKDSKIAVTIPDYDTFPGAYPVTALTFTKSSPLDSLSILIEPEESFELNYGDNFSFLWTEAPITELYDFETETGIGDDWTHRTNGLRNLMPIGSKGLCVTVKAEKPGYNKSNVEASVSIVYYDGKSTDEKGNLGREWRFTKQDNSNIMPLVEYPIQNAYELIDITGGLSFDIKKNASLGYSVYINDKCYGDIKNDIYPYWDVDLRGLNDIESGYLTVGFSSNGNGEIELSHNYTVSKICNIPAVDWAYDREPCDHQYEMTERHIADCINNGYERYTCSLCANSYKIVIPSSGHIFNEWIIIEPPSYENEGYKISFCYDCGEQSEAIPIPILEYESPFIDTDENAWYAKGLEYCVKKGYVQGNEKHEFNPYNFLTREQMVTVLARISGAKLGEYDTAPFNDVEEKDWFSEAVNWAYAEGIIKGKPNGRFGTGEPLTRQALATILYRFAAVKDTYPAIHESFADHFEIDQWAVQPICWAVSNDILGSIDTAKPILAPEMNVSRAQAVKIFMSFENKKE